MSTTPTLAIDFGTSRTKVAYFDSNKQEPRLVEIGHAVRDLIPSIFYIPKDGKNNILVGDEAEKMIERDPGGIVVALKKEIHKSGKKRIGDGRNADRIELASHLFRHIKDFVEKHVIAFHHQSIDSCILTVPVCFSDPQRNAIRQAAEKGGFRNVKTIEEPVAAARVWLRETHAQGIDSVIVCDIGGGTTDFAAVRLQRGEFHVIPEIGKAAFPEGGDNVDEMIIETIQGEDKDSSEKRSRFWSMISDLRDAFKSKIRNVKELLSLDKQDKYDVGLKDANIQIPQETINRCIHSFTDRVCDELAAYLKTCRTKLKNEKIPILLVGGSSRLPDLEDKIKRIAGASPVHRWERSDYAIVLGATLEGIIATKTPDTLEKQQQLKERTPEENYEFAVRFHGFGKYPEAAKYLHKAAEAGHRESQSLLGNWYETGKGVSKDATESVKWYLKAAEQGHAESQLNLYYIYQDGIGVPQDKTKAGIWLKRSAESGLAESQFCLSQELLSGKSFPRNEKEAVKWMYKAAEQGFPATFGYIGLFCRSGSCGVPQNDSEAVQWFRKGATQGDDLCQFELGNCYLNGAGVNQDEREALKWYRKAAAQDDAEAENMLGICYLNGRGVSSNFSEAYRWTKKAADKGLAVAQNNMGYLIDNGIGVTVNPQEAVRWYRLAAEQGYVSAITHLGFCYQSGHGVKENQSQAVQYFKTAAEQGDPEALNALGLCYMNGTGVPQIPTKGVELIHEAAEQGFPEAMYNIACYFSHGIGVEQNFEKTIEWMQLAAEAGYPDAVQHMNEISKPHSTAPTSSQQQASDKKPGNVSSRKPKRGGLSKETAGSVGEVIGATVGGAIGILTVNPKIATYFAVKGAQVGKSWGESLGTYSVSSQTDKTIKVTETNVPPKNGCPKCGFDFGWNGKSCRHCHHGE